MLREFLFAKIHEARVTECNPDYEGSITIDPEVLDVTGMRVNERVLVADCDNAARFETYVFEGDRGSGSIVVNGAAASLTAVGHRLLIMSFCQLRPQEIERHRPKVAFCNEDNSIRDVIEYSAASVAG